MKVIMRYSVVLFATCLCAVMGRTGFAQSEPLNIQLPEIQLRAFSTARFPLMNLTFDLLDNNGQAIPNLTSSQINLQEDDQSRQITALQHDINNDLVISLALVIDVSGSSQGQPLQNAIKATSDLLDNLNSNDEIAFIPVRSDVSVDVRQLDLQREVGFTTDYDQIRQVVNKLEIQGQQTALYNAMFKAVKLTSAQDMKRRAIIVMTDGRDFTNSVITENDPIDEANRNNIPIFTIGLGQPRNELYLQRVAARTGGTFQATNNPEELALLFNEVLDSLKQEYRLTYNSGLLTKDQAEHQLKLSINTRGTSISDELYFNLFSDGFRSTFSPTSTPTPMPTATLTPTPVFVPLTTPTKPVREQMVIEVATEIPPPTEIAVPTSTPTAMPTRIAINLNLNSENKTWFERIQDNPSPIIVVTLILLFLIVLLTLASRLYKRMKSQEKQRMVETGNHLESETSVTKYNLPVTKKQNKTPSPKNKIQGNVNQEELVHPTVKDPSIDLTSQVIGNSSPLGKSSMLETKNKSDKESISSDFDFPVETPQLIRVHDKQDFEISNHHVFVGRHPKSDILLKDETVSARHAVLIQSEEKILIQDIGSTNGTFVNGEQIERRKVLQDGDHLHFGKVRMLYRAPKEENLG